MPLIRLPGVFRPVADAHLLIEHLVREPALRRARVVDLCTGTGIVALAAARHGADVTAVDVSRRALFSVRANAVLAGVRVQTARGDLFAPLGNTRVDIITVNPPYLPGGGDGAPRPRGAERAWEGGSDGRALIRRICAGARTHLRPGGALLMVHSSIIGVDATLAALHAGGLTPSVVARTRGRFGPLVRKRASELRARGVLDPGQETEDLVVIRAVAPALRAPMVRDLTAAGAGSAEREQHTSSRASTP